MRSFHRTVSRAALLVASALALLLAPLAARADVAPEPRPAWDEHPAPMPPPLELATASVLVTAGIAIAVIARRRAETR